MSEEFRAIIEAQGKPINKRLKILGFNIGPVTGSLTNSPTRQQRVQYNGTGVYVLQGICINSFANSNWSVGTNLRPSLAAAVVRDRNDELLLPATEFYSGVSNFLHWSYDNLDSGVNLAPQEFLTVEATFFQAGVRWVSGCLVGTEYLFRGQ